MMKSFFFWKGFPFLFDFFRNFGMLLNAGGLLCSGVTGCRDVCVKGVALLGILVMLNGLLLWF